MADLSDVETAMVAAIAGALYPNGTGQPSTIGASAKVYRGWPNSAQLDADLKAGNIVHVSVYTMRNMVRNTTRFMRSWGTVTPAAPTMTVTAPGYTLTFSGASGSGMVAGVLHSGTAYVYTVLSTDTPSSIAAAFAAEISGATVSGATLTLPPVGDTPIGRIVASASMAMEIRRQEVGLMVSCWCPSPSVRDTASSAVDLALAQIDFLTLADGSAGWLRTRGTMEDDVPSKDALWRRNLTYTVEYGTNVPMLAPSMLFGEMNLNGGSPEYVTVAA